MEVSIFGKDIEIPEWFKQKIKETLGDITNKYFRNIIDAQVTFNKVTPSTYHCQIHVHADRSLSIRGEGTAHEVEESFTKAIERIGTQLQRYKSRLLKQRDHAPPAHELFEGRQYVYHHPLTKKQREEIPTEKFEKALTEKPTHIDTLSIHDAIMNLDLSGRPVLMFRNAETHKINVVYKQGEDKVVLLDAGSIP